jgi:hypothetical protein
MTLINRRLFLTVARLAAVGGIGIWGMAASPEATPFSCTECSCNQRICDPGTNSCVTCDPNFPDLACTCPGTYCNPDTLLCVPIPESE